MVEIAAAIIVFWFALYVVALAWAALILILDWVRTQIIQMPVEFNRITRKLGIR